MQDASGRYGDDRRRGGGGDDGGGPISNTLEATKEKLGWTKEKAEEEARYLADKAKETAGDCTFLWIHPVPAGGLTDIGSIARPSLRAGYRKVKLIACCSMQ